MAALKLFCEFANEKDLPVSPMRTLVTWESWYSKVYVYVSRMGSFILASDVTKTWRMSRYEHFNASKTPNS